MDDETVCKVLYSEFDDDEAEFFDDIDDPNYNCENPLECVLALDSDSDESHQQIFVGPNIIEASDDDDNPNTTEDGLEGAVKKGKKRSINKHLWAQNISKKCKAKGVAYVYLKKKVVSMRVTGPDCMCKSSCFAKIPDEQKQYLISYFNLIANKSKQDTYLAGLIETHNVQRHRSRLGEVKRPPKTCSAKYKVQYNSTTLYVCKKAFGSVFGISKHVIDSIVQKVKNNDFSPKVGRGKHNNRSNVQLIHTQIDYHINSFPARQSYYSRAKNADTKYLSSDLSVASDYIYKNMSLYIGQLTLKVKQNQ